MADQKRRAPMPPMYPAHEPQTGASHGSVRQFNNPAYIEVDGSQQGKKMSLPLPDYETLFPQKRHGVQGHTRWDHIIAEVNQRHRDTPVLLGPEMSVDGPEEREPSPRPSISQQSPATTHHQTHTQDTKPASTKKVAAPAPPKPVASPVPQSVVDSSQKLNQNITPQSLMRPNSLVAPASVKNDTSSRATSSDGARKVLHPSPSTTPTPRPPSQIDRDTTPSDDQNKVAMKKEAPTAKPRQRVSGKEPTQQEESAVNSNVQSLSSSSIRSRNEKENFVEFDPFPSTELLPEDPWAQPKQNKDDHLFTENLQKELKPEDPGLTPDDLNNIFGQEKTTDPFTCLNGSDSSKDDDSKQVSPAFHRNNSRRGKKILTPTTDNRTFMSQQEPACKEGTVTLRPQADVKKQSNFNAPVDPFGAEPFLVPSALASSEPLPVVLEEPASQAVGLSGGKTLLRAWVSPSEAHPVSIQNSNGGGLALNLRRPHPVKPMSTAEIQHPINTPAVKETKVWDSSAGKIKVADTMESGPYTQLTQEELITLVVKQQADLSKKDAKIVELEEYIDNLLVRVIEEKPSILHAMDAAKPV